MKIAVLLCLLAPTFAIAADGPIPPTDAPARMTLPPGFKATLFAGEPDVVQPIAMTFDGRGRLWVVECLSYPSWLPREKPGSDRVVILEDSDGDGKSDSRKVFLSTGRNLTGIAVGHGGVWLCSAPELVHVPDKDGDDVPDGPPIPILDGWDLNAKHNVFNGLDWGPDGWLYGLNGILSNSRVGPPGAKDGERVPIDCGVWRYHPVQKRFEAVAHGTTNPWGLDWDDFGRIVITNCVIHHIWHVIPGAHYERMFGQDLNPHTYRLLPSGADHIHWGGGAWQSSRGGTGVHDAPGGGHAHAGAMVYLGTNWPAEYRGDAYTCNIHGARINRDRIAPMGSTVRFEHSKDFLFANDPWFRGLIVKCGPDGGVYVADWNDTGECHDYDEVRRESGRIYKVTFGKPEKPVLDLARLDERELVALTISRSEWHVRAARLEIAERALAGRVSGSAREALRGLLRGSKEVRERLRCLWTLHVAGGLDEPLALELFHASEEQIRAWAVTLELEPSFASDAVLGALLELAKSDPSPVVRLAIASGLQRLPLESRGKITEALAKRAEDATDPYLPLMEWYAAEPLVASDPRRAEDLISMARIPLLRELAMRRLGDPEAASRLLARSGDPDSQLDILKGLETSLRGRRGLPLPARWSDAVAAVERARSTEARDIAESLSLLFGDPAALAAMRARIVDSKASSRARERALEALAQRKDAELPPILRGLLREPGPLRAQAIRALAAYDAPETPGALLDVYASLGEGERQDALATLASRPRFARALLDAVSGGKVPRREITGFTVRQLSTLKDSEVKRRLAETWGDVRPASAEKQTRLARYRALLSPEALAKADRSRGRGVFARTCASCHKLFGEGGSVGPELTGAQRSSLDYVLENLLDPGAIVARDYQMSVFITTDGRVLTGIVKEETPAALQVQTANELVVVPTGELASRERSSVSMMPEDMLPRLPDDEAIDLIGYLQGAEQAPLPAGTR